jgi:hypothetical protein
VSRVQVAHGRNECDGRLALQAFAQIRDGVDDVQITLFPTLSR